MPKPDWDVDDIVDSIDKVIEYRRERRKEVLSRHAKGMTAKQIAVDTGYKLNKVKKVIRNNG